MKGLLVLLLLAAASGRAETAQERGKRVVDEALQALGGQAFLDMQDRVESGRAYSFFREELSGLSIAKIYTRYLTEGNGPIHQRERDAFGKDEYSYLLFTPEKAWEVTYRGARPLEQQRYANYLDSVRRNIFYILHERLKEPGMTFYSQGGDLWQNRPVEIVEIADSDNLAVTVYFDKLNKLPIRQVFRRRNPQFKDFDTEETVFGKYRDVGGGVKWPFDVRRDRNGEKIFEMFAESVEINQNLTDELFSLPADVKMLPAPK